jgi:hypothetical protein
MRIADEVLDLLALRCEAVLPHLNERQRRMALGQEVRLLGHGYGFTSCATCSRASAKATARWSRPWCAPSSPRPRPARSTPSSKPSPACSNPSFPQPRPCCARPRRTSPRAFGRVRRATRRVERPRRTPLPLRGIHGRALPEHKRNHRTDHLTHPDHHPHGIVEPDNPQPLTHHGLHHMTGRHPPALGLSRIKARCSSVLPAAARVGRFCLRPAPALSRVRLPTNDAPKP